MPALDPVTKAKIEQDYVDTAGHAHTTEVEIYSDNPNDQIWGTSSYKLNMNIPLSTNAQYFDPVNPDYSEEPNLSAATTDYDITHFGGWKVTLGDNPTISYHVRTTDDQYKLRDVNQSGERTKLNNRGNQVRRGAVDSSTPKHL